MSSPSLVGDAPPSAPQRRWIGWLLWPLYAVEAVILWLAILRPPIVFPGVQLDASWKELVAFDFHERIQAGVDFVFTYGPLGYFLAGHPSYYPDLFLHRVVVDMVLKAITVILVLAPVLRIPRIWQRLVYLAVVLAVAPIADDAFVFMAITGGTLFLVLSGARLVFVVPLALFVAVLGMGKFVYFLVGAGCIGLLTIVVWRGRGVRRAVVVPIAFVASLVIVWAAIGQSIANLPAFVKGSLEISSGYNESMRWVPIDGKRWYFGDVVLALGALSLTTTVTLLACLRRPWQLRRWLAAAAIGAVSFMTWKSGFVRQDSGHTLIFFCCAAVVPMWAWTLGEPARRRLLVNGAVLATIVIAFVGAFRLETDFRPDMVWPLLRHQVTAHADFLRDLEGNQARLDKEARQLAREHQLPATKQIVGDAPIDQVPHDQSLLFLNGLSIRHRPIFQSYSAYTPYLQRLNGDFYADPQRGPRFVLFRVDAIDAQYPTVADSQMYFSLLRNFRPRLFERGHVLFERDAAAAAAPVQRRQVAQSTARLEEWVEVPPAPELGELAIDLPFSLLGSAWSFVIRGPRLFMDVRLANGEVVENFVVSRGSMHSPFLLDPMVDTRAFTKLWCGAQNLRRVTAFRIRARGGQERLYRAEFGYTLWRSELPRPIDGATERSLRIDSQMFDRAPHSEEPAENFVVARDGDAEVRLAQPPSAMTFAEIEGRVVVTGAYGLLSGAWEGTAASDGVTFRIERVAGGAATVLFERRLDPERNEADRGRQGFVVDTTLQRGDVLVLRTMREDDNRWDFSYWTDLQFADPAVAAMRPLRVDTVELTRAASGTQRFTIDAGRTFANRRYQLLGTAAGTTPGHPFAGIDVPLNSSKYFDVTSGDLPDSAVFEGFRGTLDAEGRAHATLHVPAGAFPGANGFVLHHAFVVFDDDGRGLSVSNPVPLFLR